MADAESNPATSRGSLIGPPPAWCPAGAPATRIDERRGGNPRGVRGCRLPAGPPFPRTVVTAHHEGRWGRMRSRSVGRPRPGVPELVMVQGLAVADYLLPGVASFGGWTRAHLLELPGFDGAPDGRRGLTVVEFGRAVADWLTARHLDRVVVAGHS